MITMAQRSQVATVRFSAVPSTIQRRTVLRLPNKASRQLPSRGQVAVEGTINGREFQTVVEPDGCGGHWISVDEKLQRAARIHADDVAAIELEPTGAWPEPKVPADLRTALAASPKKIQDIWRDITPMARWEWVRWVNATTNPNTRKRRVEVSITKMNTGKRRPCCFNLAGCTDPELSKNGRLLGIAPKRPPDARASGPMR